MIKKILVSAITLGVAIVLAAPASADDNPIQHFFAAVRAAGITGTDPAMLGDGYNVCWELWNAQTPATKVAAGLLKDYPTLTIAQAAHFVIDAYQNLCPVPGAYDWWAYGQGGAGGGAGGA